VPLLGQDRNRGRPTSFVLHCEGCWIGNLSQRSLAGTGPFDLGNNGDTRPAEARHRIDCWVDVLTSFLQPFERNLLLSSGQILPNSGDDLV
jgi:hypothetical protein